jgi:ATP-binding cassette subfamily F protein 3
MSTEAKVSKKVKSTDGKKKVMKKKAKVAVSKEDMKRLKMMAKAFAYGVQYDMVDLERSTQVMSAVTLVELKAVLNSLLSSEKINATAQGRRAMDWAAAADHLKDSDAVLLFNQLKTKQGVLDLKTFLDNAVTQVKVAAHEKQVTAKDKAEAKRVAKFAELDWTSEEAVITCFPEYVQQQMAMARTKNVTKSIDLDDVSIQVPFSKSEYLLDMAELHIPQRAKMALMGAPGSGKSVLFAAMAAQEIKGWPMHLQVHHMTEIQVSADAESLIDTVVHANVFLTRLHQCEEELKARIAKEQNADAKAKMTANLNFVQTKLRENGAEDAVERAAASLRVLGFDDVAQLKSTNSLSGGLRMRVALCASFFVEADLLLLDEPTNHLDFPSLLWLENRLRSYRKSFVVVCHDREILNNTCTSVTTITEDQGLKLWNMNYDAYEKARDKAEKKLSVDVQKFLDRNRNVDAASPLYAQVYRKRQWLNEYNRKVVMRMGQFVFPPPDALEADNEQKGVEVEQKDVSIIKIDDVRFSYDPITLPFIFDNPISIDITLDTRMGVMGPNGAGKSTFLKLITGRLNPVSGNIYTNGNARIGYFAQHHSAEMDLNTTPMETMQNAFPEAKSGLLTAHLGKCGVLGDMCNTRMNDLSQGMRSCVGFAKITYVCPHLLIMDEPTNFLDIETVDSLISAANKYKGALLLVSHSRLFLQKCATSYLSIVPGQFLTFDNLKTCEQATYTFIAELEAGTKVKIGAGALAKHGANAGSGSTSEVQNDISEGIAI